MESRDMFLACSEEGLEEGKSQFETREKDFFFRKGGCRDWRTRGRGGGGGRARSGRDGGREEMEEEGEGVVNAAEASVKGVRRAGMWTVFDGAVLGRWSA
jgi:hypothetical protein